MVFWTPWDQIGTKWEEEEVVWLLAGCVSGITFHFVGAPRAPGATLEAPEDLR